MIFNELSSAQCAGAAAAVAGRQAGRRRARVRIGGIAILQSFAGSRNYQFSKQAAAHWTQVENHRKIIGNILRHSLVIFWPFL